jgi:hypothetical protein
MLRSTGGGAGAALMWKSGADDSYSLALGEDEGRRICFQNERAAFRTVRREAEFSWEWGGTYSLKIETDGKKVSAWFDGKLVGEHENSEQLKPGAVELSVYHAVAQFCHALVTTGDKEEPFMDDFSFPRPWDWSGQPLQKAKRHRDVGINIYTADGLGGLYNWDECFLSSKNKYVFKKIDRDFNRILQHDPKAVFVPRVTFRPPQWWCDLNPSEMMTLRHPGGEEARYKYAAYTSELWLEETSNFLRQYIRHLNSQNFGDRIAGFTLMAGGGGEWVYSFEPYYFDYSKPQEKAYRNWLKEKHTDIAALRSAWNNPTADFSAVVIPSPAQKSQAFDFEFRDPVKARFITDYMRFHSVAVTNAIDRLARVVREETDGKKLVIVFYGYLLGGGRSPNFLESGHMNLSGLLRSPYVDCAGSLHDYYHRAEGGVTVSAAPVDSVSLHGKMPFSEDDIRTHLSAGTALNSEEGRTKSLKGTLNVIKRDFAYFLSKSSGFWYMDWGNGWFYDDTVMDLIGNCRGVADESLSRDRRKADEIAVIVSEDSYDYLRNPARKGSLLRDLVSRQVVENLTRIGAPFGAYTLSDLDKMPEHKLYIFLNAFYLTERERETIERKIKGGGKIALWLYAPGYIQNDRLSTDAIGSVTGIKVIKEELSSMVEAETTGRALCPAAAPGKKISWGKDGAAFGPLFYGGDDNAVTLAVFKAPSALAGKPAMMMRERGSWRSIWCGVPNIPAGLLREIARLAGAHIYSETDDFLVANRFMVSLHAKETGEKTVSLPRRTCVTDAFSKQCVIADSDKFTVHMETGETGVWLLEESNK